MKDLALLEYVSWGVIVLALLTVVVPYIRRKRDLLSCWNLFLLGVVSYVGFSGLEAASKPDYFRVLRAEFAPHVYAEYAWGTVTMLAALYLGYYVIKLPRRAADIFPRKWPPASTAVLLFMLPVLAILAVGSVFPPQIPVVFQFFTQVGNKAIVFALVLAFVAWYRQKVNPIFLVAMILAVILGAVFAVMSGGGRRTLLNVIIAIPLCVYWLTMRYKSPWLNLTLAGAFGIVAFVFVGAYSQVRHLDRRGTRVERTFSFSVDALRQLPSKLSTVQFEELMGQHAVQYALASIQLYSNGDLEPDPFNATIFVVTNPIPREYWEDKPLPLGFTLPRDARAKTTANWGAGVVGHGFHEGGLHMVAFYAVIAGMVLRYFDELLRRQSSNPYVLAGFAAIASHIYGWTRGDIGTFTIQIVGACVLVVLLMIIGRVLFGTGVVYPRMYSSRGGAGFVSPPLVHRASVAAH